MRTLVLILLYCFSFPAGNDDKKDNDLLLNAESSSTPREINIGLPDSGDGAVVYVDGCKHALGLPKGRFHWAGGNAYERIGTISLMESVIRVGEIGVLVDSHTKTGGATFGGVVTAGTSSNGRIFLDAFAGGPVLKNTPWTWSAGAFINYDPTAVNAPGRRFIDRKQIYQATLSRRVKDSQLCLIYRFSFSGDSFGNAYNVAPFIYNGDGSASFTEGFRPGRDCYFPSDAHIRYMDVACGEMKSGNLNGLDRVITHDLNLVYSKKLSRGWKYDTHSHVCFMPTASFARTSLAGIDDAGVSSGYTNIMNEGGLAIAPLWDKYLIRKARKRKVILSDGNASWSCRLSRKGLMMTLRGEGLQTITIPVLTYDGGHTVCPELSDGRLAFSRDGACCEWKTNGKIVDTGKDYANRDGHLRRYDASAKGRLKVRGIIYSSKKSPSSSISGLSAKSGRL